MKLKPIFVALWVLGMAGYVQSASQEAAVSDATSPAVANVANVSQERTRIEALRAQESARFDALEQACYGRFAVNGCIKDVQAQRRAVLGPLKREIQALNATERQQQAAAKLQTLQQKAEEKALDDAQKERAAMQSGSQEVAARQPPSPTPRAAVAPRGDKTTSVTIDPVTQAQNRASYEDKQAQAAQRRAEVAKRLQEKKSAAPLAGLPSRPTVGATMQ